MKAVTVAPAFVVVPLPFLYAGYHVMETASLSDFHPFSAFLLLLLLYFQLS